MRDLSSTETQKGCKALLQTSWHTAELNTFMKQEVLQMFLGKQEKQTSWTCVEVCWCLQPQRHGKNGGGGGGKNRTSFWGSSRGDTESDLGWGTTSKKAVSYKWKLSWHGALISFCLQLKTTFSPMHFRSSVFVPLIIVFLLKLLLLFNFFTEFHMDLYVLL